MYTVLAERCPPIGNAEDGWRRDGLGHPGHVPGLPHREFGLQAATLIGAPGGNANQLLLSNAVRVTVGGGL